MTAQQLIYEAALPLSSVRHRDCSVEADPSYAFAKHINSVPVLGIEFPAVAMELPIVFAGEGEALCPAAILSMRNHDNVLVDGHDPWKGRYVPAFLRRYPFVYASTPESNRYTLCVDEAFAGLNREGRGERLFDDAGKPTSYTDGVLKFVSGFAQQFSRTQKFCRRIQELGLLEPMEAQARFEGGRQVSLTGFSSVNRERLHKLSPEAMASLSGSDELELIYLHLQSLRNFLSLRERMSHADKAVEVAPASETARELDSE